MAKAKLKQVLRQHQNKDPKVERQKKLQKDAEKRKRHANSVQSNGHDAQLVFSTAADDEREKLEASDSESEGDGPEEEALNTAFMDESDTDSADGVELEEALPRRSRQPSNSVPIQNGEDIPLSDLSSAGSDEEDIVPYQRLTINNIKALEHALASFAVPTTSLPFSEHQSIMSKAPVNVPDVEDDLQRELAFYSQALVAVEEARLLLTEEGVPFTRPTDYFAEMVKSDEHMDKIKSKLVEDAAGKKAAAEARKQRDLKKFGKEVQQEKLKERARDRKDMLERVNVLKRKRKGADIAGPGDGDMFDVALEDAATTVAKEKQARREKAVGDPKGQKRQRKDDKFGFGGKKRFSKSSDAASSGDMSGYSAKKMKAKTGASKRLGKARRAKPR